MIYHTLTPELARQFSTIFLQPYNPHNKTINYIHYALFVIQYQYPPLLLQFLLTSYLYSTTAILSFTIPLHFNCKLTILQNSIARCIFNIPKYSHTHISPFLDKLHWLPVRHRILYKNLLLDHKAIDHDSPDYLVSLLKLKLPTSTTTRSTNTFLLEVAYFNYLLNITYIQLTLAHWQYTCHTPGTLSLYPSVLHHQLQTSRNY